MNYNDIIGTVGVGLILMAFFLNTARLIENNGKLYYVLNSIGAVLACYASFLINYWPFVILEGTWTLVSIYGLMKTMKIKMT
jgi:CHASE2 domain-containing sensor protein